MPQVHGWQGAEGCREVVFVFSVFCLAGRDPGSFGIPSFLFSPKTYGLSSRFEPIQRRTLRMLLPFLSPESTQQGHGSEQLEKILIPTFSFPALPSPGTPDMASFLKTRANALYNSSADRKNSKWVCVSCSSRIRAWIPSQRHFADYL